MSVPTFPPPVTQPYSPAPPPPLRQPTPAPPRRGHGDHGQATTEYALILLAAALVGLLVVAWATAGGAAGRIGQLFDQVVDSVISRL
ncbi:hypothetical protein BH23ACT3_BH23ACT3_16940 [soil metagenome]